MLQFLVSFLPLMAGLSAIFALAFKMKRQGACMTHMLGEFGRIIDNSPAQVAFFMFSITAAISASLAASAFAHISNQLIISLDILFFLSSMLLILFHRFKEYASASL